MALIAHYADRWLGISKSQRVFSLPLAILENFVANSGGVETLVRFPYQSVSATPNPLHSPEGNKGVPYLAVSSYGRSTMTHKGIRYMRHRPSSGYCGHLTAGIYFVLIT